MLDLARLAPERLRLLRRSEYDRMVASGMFEHEHIELLRGLLVEMSPIGADHGEAVSWLSEKLVRALAGRARVRTQTSFAASEDSEPEPDIAIVPTGRYWGELPSTALLLIEVAESSLSKDRHIKSDLYAEAQVAEYWIVNLVDSVVEIFREPVEGRYTRMSRHGRGETIAPAGFADVLIPVDEILPPAR